MSDDTSAVGGASAPFPSPVTADPEPGATASKLPGPIRSNIPTPATSGTGIPQPSKMKAPSSFGSTGSVSKIGRPCCNHTTPKSGPPPREAASMSRESDDNLSSINSAYTDLYQETVRRFTRSSLSPTSDWDRFSPARRSLKSEAGSRASYNSSAVLTANTEQFIIGQRVWLGGTRPGQIAFIGDTHFAAGEWAGVVLDEPNGKNDGCVSGKRYFQCEPKRGIFSRLTRLTTYPMAGAQTPTSPLAKNSPDRSRTVSPTASIRSSMLRSPGIGGKNGMAVGDRVIVSSGFGSRPGILRYLGETQFAPGNWCGVELDEPSGKNDGTVDDIRYFECKPKYGVFVPIAKVSLSPSSKKTRLSRTGSRESLTSIGTMNSIATTATSRMRMNAQQRKSSTPVKPILATPKSQFSMQDLLREKQQHVEKLMVERDLDREDAQNQALQLQKNINEVIIFTDTMYAPLPYADRSRPYRPGKKSRVKVPQQQHIWVPTTLSSSITTSTSTRPTIAATAAACNRQPLQQQQQQPHLHQQQRAKPKKVWWANANISATNAELSTVLEVLQAEKSETNHIFELFEMEADMNSERLIEKVTGIKEELKETHLQLDERQKKIEELEEKLKQTQQSEQKVQQESQTSKEQLTELHQSLQELQDSVKQKEELVQNLEEKVRESSSIIEGQNTKLNESNVQLENQTSCLKETQDQLLESQKKEKTLQEEAAKLSGELQQVQEANGDIKDSLVKVEELVKVLEEKLQAATSQLESQQATHKKLQELLVKSQENEGNLQGESLAVTEKLHQLEQANGELKEALCQKENGLKELEGKLEESNTLLESQKKSHNEIQDKLEQAQQKERNLQEETSKLAEQLSQLKQANEELQKSLQQKQLLLEKGNEFDTQLAEYQKVIDEMDDAASVKSTLLEQLQKRVAELEAALRQANDAQKTAYLEAQELRRQLESLELEKSREVLSLKAQINGASSRIGQGDEVESLDTETSLAKINFLNSIIADMQQKNDALKAKVQTLETLPMDFTKPHAFDALTRRKPAPRLFCDICDEFDQHDTEDCPIQGSEDQDYTIPSSESNNNDKERKLPAPRKYCDSCEVFGHDTSECADDETY
ncbi:GD24107 [Drosophila simulans]|uniref:GD24107 n=1 Tax=Drosophila simulans TaxID=7240 RepID=B4Q7X3_DROSI|nr:GD24107 [Drosophila simulans]